MSSCFNGHMFTAVVILLSIFLIQEGTIYSPEESFEDQDQLESELSDSLRATLR